MQYEKGQRVRVNNPALSIDGLYGVILNTNITGCVVQIESTGREYFLFHGEIAPESDDKIYDDIVLDMEVNEDI